MSVMKKLIILPHFHLFALTSVLFTLGFWVVFGCIYWKEITNQANLVILYVFGLVLLAIGVAATILIMKRMKMPPF